MNLYHLIDENFFSCFYLGGVIIVDFIDFWTYIICLSIIIDSTYRTDQSTEYL